LFVLNNPWDVTVNEGIPICDNDNNNNNNNNNNNMESESGKDAFRNGLVQSPLSLQQISSSTHSTSRHVIYSPSSTSSSSSSSSFLCSKVRRRKRFSYAKPHSIPLTSHSDPSSHSSFRSLNPRTPSFLSSSNERFVSSDSSTKHLHSEEDNEVNSTTTTTSSSTTSTSTSTSTQYSDSSSSFSSEKNSFDRSSYPLAIQNSEKFRRHSSNSSFQRYLHRSTKSLCSALDLIKRNKSDRNKSIQSDKQNKTITPNKRKLHEDENKLETVRSKRQKVHFKKSEFPHHYII
jgi:hypothetical protein